MNNKSKHNIVINILKLKTIFNNYLIRCRLTDDLCITILLKYSYIRHYKFKDYVRLRCWLTKQTWLNLTTKESKVMLWVHLPA